nr:MAG TPA: hypothetical protein [Caudoviricetes sp.]
MIKRTLKGIFLHSLPRRSPILPYEAKSPILRRYCSFAVVFSPDKRKRSESPPKPSDRPCD